MAVSSSPTNNWGAIATTAKKTRMASPSTPSPRRMNLRANSRNPRARSCHTPVGVLAALAALTT